MITGGGGTGHMVRTTSVPFSLGAPDRADGNTGTMRRPTGQPSDGPHPRGADPTRGRDGIEQFGNDGCGLAGLDVATREAGLRVEMPDHLAVVDNEHFVERRQLVGPVGDVEEAGTGGGGQDVMDKPFGGRLVEARGRLIEDEHRRPGQEGAGQGQALALATRELRSLFADRRVEAAWQRVDPRAELCRPGGGGDLPVVRAAPGRAMFASRGPAPESSRRESSYRASVMAISSPRVRRSLPQAGPQARRPVRPGLR